MTLNQIVKRIETLALAHRQVRTFRAGLRQDFLSNGDIRYSAVFLQYAGSNVLRGSNAANFVFTLSVRDLVHVSEDTKTNELDVLSDTFSILLDLLSQMGYSGFNDWRVIENLSLTSVVEDDGDMSAGWDAGLTISVMYDQNVCEVPSDIPDLEPFPEEKDTKVYDQKYIADGNEGSTLPTDDPDNYPDLSVLNGKKILLVTREYTPLYRVSNLPQGTEFTWNDINVGLGLPTLPGERFLFLYRNY